MIAILVALAVFALDRWTKLWALSHLALGSSQPVIGRLVTWTLIENSGAAFGLFSGATFAFIIAAVLAVGALLYALRTRPGWLVQVGIGGLLGGALGNLYDRIVMHRVVDFIDVHVWPYIFNVADIGITLGAAILVLTLWRRDA